MLVVRSGIETAAERGMKLKRLTYSGTKEAKPDVTIRQVLDRLAEYEDLEETETLIKLPCPIGHRVYEIYRFLDEGAWEIEEHKIRLEDLEKIGKTVFLTREEAEAAIERKGDEG